MHTRAFAVLALLVALATTAAAQARPSAPRAIPTIRVVDGLRVTVTGRGFRPLEHVRLTLWAGRTPVTRWAETGRSGRFSAWLPKPPGGVVRCGGFRVSARGTKGSLALWRIPLPACHPGGEQARAGRAAAS